MAHNSLTAGQMIAAMKSLQMNVAVSTSYDGQMKQIEYLLKNDETGIVNTVLDFMIHCATVPITIETKNSTLDFILSEWQTKHLNKNVGIDIPRGLRELSTENFRERWKSSLQVLNILWDEVDFGGDNGTWLVPSYMYFSNGANITIHEDKPGDIGTRHYYSDKAMKSELKNEPKVGKGKSLEKTVIIRKPFDSWHSLYPTPYLVKRGTLFNALFKKAVMSKQTETIQAIVPYLLLMKSGTDKLAELDALLTKEQMLALKDTIVDAQANGQWTKDLKELLAVVSYDVNFEHVIPDLKKVLADDVLKGTDKNLLASLGLVELVGFSKTRQEAVLNPKVMVEEVKDGVADWKSVLEEVMFQFLEKNVKNHSSLIPKAKIQVVPHTIKAFLTDEMRSMLRNLSDKGLLSIETSIEDIGDLNAEVEADRRTKEAEKNWNNLFFPRVTQNLPKGTNVDPNSTDLTPDDRQPDSPEAKNFENAEDETEEIKITAPWDNIDQLPEAIRKSLPVPAQIIFLRVADKAFEDGKSEETAIMLAWGVVKKSYRPPEDGEGKKWKKK